MKKGNVLNTDQNRLLVILGPTATGKTRLAVAAARELNGEVISADSRQVYRGMDVGTGKDLEEYGEGGSAVPYHMIDLADPGDEFNLFEFQRRFVVCFNDIVSRGVLPVLCGGTGLYIESIIRRYKLAESKANVQLREDAEGMTMEDLAARLSKSKVPHNTTDTLDRERLLRAIEIAETIEPEESIVPELKTDIYGLRLDRDSLRANIEKRLKYRLENGLIQEIEALLEFCRPSQLELYGLEYRLVTAFVRGKLSRNDMFQKLNSAIFQFAKKQENWFRRMERNGIEIKWLEAKDPLSVMVDKITTSYSDQT